MVAGVESTGLGVDIGSGTERVGAEDAGAITLVMSMPEVSIPEKSTSPKLMLEKSMLGKPLFSKLLIR